MVGIDEKQDEIEQSSEEDRSTLVNPKHSLAANTVSQMVFFVFNAFTSLVMVPYQISHLGLSNYGVVTLASQVAGWTQIASAVLVSGIGRFIMLNIAQKNIEKARSYLNTQFISVLSLVLFLLPITLVFSYLAPSIFRIPAGQEMNTRIVFFSIYLCVLMNFIVVPYKVATYVKQKFYIRNWLDMLNQALRYGTWILLFSVFGASLWQIGAGYIVGTIALLICTAYWFYRLTPELKPRPRGFDSSKFKDLTSMGSWVAVGQLGVMLYMQSDAAVINRIFGPASVGKYGTILGLSVQIRMFSAALLSLISPSVVTCYANGDHSGIMRIISRSSKFVSLGMAITVGIICGLSVPFLTRWLGPEFKSLSILVWLMFGHLVFNMGMDSPAAVSMAANRVAVVSIATIVGGVIKIILAIVLAKYTTLGLCAVALAELIGLSLKNMIFQPIYISNWVLKRSSLPLYKSMVAPAFIFIITSAMALWASKHFDLASYPRLGLSGMVVLIISGCITYLFALGKDDRRFIRDVVPFLGGKRAKKGM